MTRTTDSQRVASARKDAELRLRRQRGALRPLGRAVLAVVVISTIAGHPRPGLHGSGLALIAALAVFVVALALGIQDRFASLEHRIQGIVVAAMGAAGAALAGLQPHGATELAGGAAVWMAVVRLPLRSGVALALAITVALDLAAALAGSSAAAVAAATLLCAMLGLVAHFMKQSRDSQDRTELLLAQLEDAREEQARAAAIAERGRIASELHDVLAHSLSGAAIQLQGARMLAEREQAAPEVRSAIDRATALVRDGLANARQAVGTLRGGPLPSVEQLGWLLDSYRDDMKLDITMRTEGTARPLSADAGLALYRCVQEALTNVARYAPTARTSIVLRYEPARTRLTVEDTVPAQVPAAGQAGLGGVGGGRGLVGLRERAELAGGTLSAGPTDSGWRVELELPG